MKNISRVLIAIVLTLSISCNKEDAERSEINNSQGIDVDSGVSNIVMFVIPSFDNEIHSFLTNSNFSQGLRKFNNIAFYSPTSYFESFSDLKSNLTALMSGTTTLNGYLGIDKDSTRLNSWLYNFKNTHKIGLISNETLGSGYIKSMFNGNIISSNVESENTVNNLIKFKPDFIWAPGKRFFDRRSDKKNLFQEMSVKNYDLNFNINNLKVSDSNNYAGIFNSFSIPDTVDIISNGLSAWNTFRSKKEKPFVLIIILNDFDNVLDSDALKGKQKINQYFDRIFELSRNIEANTLYAIVNPFNSYSHDITFYANDSLTVSSTKLNYNFSHLPIWTYGKNSDAFKGYLKNTDIPNKLRSIQKK